MKLLQLNRLARRSLVAGLASVAMLTSTLLVTAGGSASAATCTYRSFSCHVSQIVLTMTETTTVSGALLSPQPTVTLETNGGTTVTGAPGNVSAAVSTGATLGGTTTASASSGVATFTDLTLTKVSGTSPYTLTFTYGSLTATKSIAVTPTGATHLAVHTQPSTPITSGTSFANPVVVYVEDGTNLPITGNSSVVTASVTSAGGTVTNATATAVDGVATFTNLAVNALVSLTPYTLTFTEGLLTVTSSSFVVNAAGVAAKLALTTAPSLTTTSGAVLVAQPVVTVEDLGGNIKTGYSRILITAASSVGATVTAGSYAYVTTATGSATFSGLVLTGAVAASYTLTFSAPTINALTPVTATIAMLAGVASKLVVTTQPSTSVASGATLAVVPVVKVEDAQGNVVTTNTSIVTATFTAGGVSLTNPSATAVAGVATFTGLALNALVGSYTLTFTDPTLTTAVSSAVTVSVGAAAKLVVTTEPSVITSSGAVLTQQPTITVRDSGGNVVTSLSTGVVTATLNTGSGGAVSAGATASISSGVAVFSGLALTGTGGTKYTLLYTGASFSVADATAISMELLQSPLAVTSLRGYYGRTLVLSTSGGSGTGTVSFAVANGSATGCALSGNTLSYTSTGTCLVTASKAGDGSYLSTTSTSTTVTIQRLPIPAATRVTFIANRSGLTATGRQAIVVLLSKLTNESTVTLIGYAPHNRTLARQRVAAVRQYLTSRLNVTVHVQYVTVGSLNAVRMVTTGQ